MIFVWTPYLLLNKSEIEPHLTHILKSQNIKRVTSSLKRKFRTFFRTDIHAFEYFNHFVCL